MNNNPVGQTCPYCQFPIKPDEAVTFCSACGLPHHRQCWQENGKCTTFGCTGHQMDSPTYPAGNQNVCCIDLTTEDVVCQRCGSSHSLGVAFCTNCGANLSAIQQTPNVMFCCRCGARNFATNNMCTNCGTPMQSSPCVPIPQVATVYNPSYQTAVIPTNIDNHMVFAILSTLFCCLPCGIVAIVYASKVNGRLQVGDYTGAIMAANNAKTWCWIALGTGIFIGFISLLGS